MTELLTICAVVVAVVAGIRSTWSPCGLSMLSTITPMAERGRGHRWSATATWYLCGAVAGGATLGAVLAAGAAAIHALDPPPTTAAVILAVISLVAASSDAGLAKLPIHHRQVNERWLDTYRPSVYATGFGWQIGAGVVTYIKTSAVYLLIALAALTARPLVALGVGVLFGLVRGGAVFASWRVTDSAALASFHRRFAELGRASRTAVVVTELGVALTLTGAAVSPAAPALVVIAVASILLATTAGSRRQRRRSRQRQRQRQHDEAVAPATSPGGSRSARTA